MINKVLLIANIRAGKGLSSQQLTEIIDIYCKSKYTVETYITQSSGDATNLIADIDLSNYSRIVCCGGDGTLNEVVNGLVNKETAPPLVYLPTGSTNDFASSIGLSSDNLITVENSISNSVNNNIKCDIGLFNSNNVFTYIAAFGIFTNTSYETPQTYKNMLGHLAYLLEGVKGLQSVKSYKLEVTFNNNTYIDDFIYGMITNGDSVGGFKDLTGKHIDMSDGLFEITLIKRPRNIEELNDVLTSLVSKDFSNSKMIINSKASEVSIKTYNDTKIAWTLDGEFGGEHSEVSIKNLHNKIDIIV